MSLKPTASPDLYLQTTGSGPVGRSVRHESWHRRKARLKALFEGRCRQLDEASGAPWPPTPEAASRYSWAVIRYTRARRAWRSFRGWK